MESDFDHESELARLRRLRDVRKDKPGFKANVAEIERVIALYEGYLAPEERPA